MNEIQGDVLSVYSGIILQQVNCQGKMNSGVAKAIRNKYPEVYLKYLEYCKKENKPEDLLGRVQIVQVTDELYIANLFSQLNYGYNSVQYTNYAALDTCLESLAISIERMPKLKVHHPKIGAGLGGGDWSIISKMIETHLGETTLWVL